MVDNLKQLRKRHCTSIIQQIKQDPLKNKFFVSQTRIGIENFFGISIGIEKN